MLVEQSKLTICYDALRYSLNPLVRVLIPFKKIRVIVRGNAYKKFTGIIANLLEDIDNYNLLSKMLHDIQIPTDSTYGKLALLEGTRPDMIATTPTFDAAAVTTTGNADPTKISNVLSNRNIRVQSISSGDVLKRTAAGATTHLIDDTQSTNVETYCLNLVSLVGSLCSQNYLPLFAMTSAPLRLEIQLVDDLRRAMNCSAAPNAASNALTFLDNVEFVAQMIELSDSAMSIISSSLGGSPLQFVIPSYRNYQYALTTTEGVATQANFPIAAKFSSLKSLFVTHRDKINTATFFPMSCVTAGLSDYQFRVGSVPVPAKAVNTRAEQFAELLKAIGSLSDISHQPSIELPAFNLGISQANTNVTDAIAASGIHSGAFYVGLNLENYEASAKDTIFAGWNSNTDDIYYVANLTVPLAGQNAAPVTIRFDAFALYDAVVVCENQTAYVRF